MCVCVDDLVSSDERMHSQVVLHHFLCHIWRMGRDSAPQKRGGTSLRLLVGCTGFLHVLEEGVPRLERQIQRRGIKHEQEISLSEKIDFILEWTIFIFRDLFV